MMIGSLGTLELALLAIVTIGVCLITQLVTKRWLWALGLVACMGIAIVNTPADPISTLIVGVPACSLYILSAWAWQASKSSSINAK